MVGCCERGRVACLSFGINKNDCFTFSKTSLQVDRDPAACFLGTRDEWSKCVIQVRNTRSESGRCVLLGLFGTLVIQRVV